MYRPHLSASQAPRLTGQQRQSSSIRALAGFPLCPATASNRPSHRPSNRSDAALRKNEARRRTVDAIACGRRSSNGAFMALACLLVTGPADARDTCERHPLASSAMTRPAMVADGKYKGQIDYAVVLQSAIFDNPPSSIDGHSHGGVLADGALFSFDFRHAPDGPVIAPFASVCPGSLRDGSRKARKSAIARASDGARTFVQTEVRGLGRFKVVADAKESRSDIYLRAHRIASGSPA